MYLYNLTLQKSTAIYCAVHGNFTGTKNQEIAISRGKIIELLRADPNTGKLHVIFSQEVFGKVRSLLAFRLTGTSKDYLVVGSDSGKIVILEYQNSKNSFDKVHQEIFGKSGCRRIVPGQMLAMDPKGRAVMIGATEKQKFVYILNRDASANLTISSPLEAHKSYNVLFDICGMDVGFENPLFAALEMDYEEADNHTIKDEGTPEMHQSLTYYELDLGLNHVVRKSCEPNECYGNMMISVPGGSDGPGGVIICCENYLYYKNLGHPPIKISIPRRKNDLSNPERSLIIISTATHKTKNLFFFLLQTEMGDLFKLTLIFKDEMVSEIRLRYFDTLPPACSLCILKTGFLFAASEFGNHGFYQIIKLGDDPNEPEFSSVHQVGNGQQEDWMYFQPRELRNLVLVDEMESLAPIIDCKIMDLANEDTPQFYMIKGVQSDSKLTTLRHGLEVSEMAISDLPGNPCAVWSVKKNSSDIYHHYIVVSFVNATLVLSIGETVEEVSDSGLLGTTPTLACSILGEDAMVQIHPEGIRHIKHDKRINEWRSPAKRLITKCAVNERQIVVALAGNEIVYFELDQFGQLNEYTERKELPAEVLSVALGPIPKDHQRSRFLAVALRDQTVRIVSLDPNDCLQPLSMQALPTFAESLCIVLAGEFSTDSELGYLSRLFLNIGLTNGVLLRTVLDPVTGDLTDTRTRYLGCKPVKLFKIVINESSAILAISSRTWLSYHHQSRYHLTPLSYDVLDHGSSFASEQCPEGIVAIAQNTLRILSIEKLGNVFNQLSYPLKYTPRKMLLEPSTNLMVIIESDQNAYTTDTITQLKLAMEQGMRNSIVSDSLDSNGIPNEHTAIGITEDAIQNFINSDVGNPKAGLGHWASLIRIIDPSTGEMVQEYKFPQDEFACSFCFGQFQDFGNQTYLIVGTAFKLSLNPRKCETGFIHTFEVNFFKSSISSNDDTEDSNAIKGKFTIQHLHATPVEDVPGALASFQGKVLAGVGKVLRMYDMGKKKLLRKCENKKLPSYLMNIQCVGHRIIVSDVQESFHFLKYKRKENLLSIFADDFNPRFLTCSCLLDYNTLAGADKFGNVFVVRLPEDVKDDLDEDPTGIKSLWDKGYLSGAPQKLETLCNFYCGETIHSLQKTSLIPGGSDVICFTTLSGSIGILIPFSSREDIEFFQHLEMHMRQENPPLGGRDHLWFRSYYHPVKSVIDGDLCEQYNSLDVQQRRSIAEQLDRTPAEISKKLEDLRTRFAF